MGGVGLLGKLVADSFEEVVRGLRVPWPRRAARVQVFFAATLLGIVGAGGIGFYLLNASWVLDFDVVTTILIMVSAR